MQLTQLAPLYMRLTLLTLDSPRSPSRSLSIPSGLHRLQHRRRSKIGIARQQPSECLYLPSPIAVYPVSYTIKYKVACYLLESFSLSLVSFLSYSIAVPSLSFRLRFLILTVTYGVTSTVIGSQLLIANELLLARAKANGY